MKIYDMIRRITFRDWACGFAGALLAAVGCFIPSIMYPDVPRFVFLIIITLGFLAGVFFGSKAILALLHLLADM
jgi:hypothetical protein